MTLDLAGVISWFLVGMMTGTIATQFLTGRGFGAGGDMAIAIAGGLLAGLLVSLIGFQAQLGLVLSTFGAFAGAVLITALARRLRLQLVA
jgi:uncharacterized membrane protein YeaQ/YmgE (transglycosylase-associated protein family)